MTDLAKRIEETQIETGSLGIFWLAQAGFETSVGASRAQEQPTTLLVDFGRASEDLRRQLLQALGLSQAAVRVGSGAVAPADFRLVLGDDYDPCFAP